jgi:CubicO group peptidase (beta-lactamase class C family)
VKVRYSDTNYQLLGAIVEATTGAAFDAALRGELLEPLGLHHTWMAGTDAAAEHPEPTPIRNPGGQLDLPLAFGSMGPDGGLVGTAADAIGFLRALHADPDCQLATMTARWHRFGLPRSRAALLTPGWPIEYGLGIMRFRRPRPLNAGRRGPALIGHTGVTGSWAFHSPEAGLYLAGSFNSPRAAAEPYRIVPALARAYAD